MEWLFQASSTLGMCLFTAFLFAQLESRHPIRHLRADFSVSLKMIVLAVVAMLSPTFIDFLSTLNGKMPIPQWLGFLADLEKRAADETNALLSFKQFGQFVAATVVLAVIPAIAEEFFFRCIVLGDFLKEKMNPAVAITASGLIFAICHLEFHNTPPQFSKPPNRSGQ